METNDKQLLLACRRGDQSSWETLIHRYQRLIYAIPRRAGLNEDDSSEVFQDVFATLFQKLHDIEDPDRLHAWLVTTAKRKTWRTISKSRQWQQTSSADSHQESEVDQLAAIADDSPLPDAEMVRLEQQHQVRMALSALDERCRRLLELLFYRDEPPSYAEIASSLGTSEGSIGPTRARCLSKMLRLLDK
jgi:RNA polymerase sigma factor (sigma-70 family)